VDVNSTPPPLYRRERVAVPVVEKAGWASGTIWTDTLNRKFLGPTGFPTPDCSVRSESLYRRNQPPLPHPLKKW